MKNKLNINWRFAAVLFFVAAGLIIITHSFFISLGIMLLLFVIDHFAQVYDERRKLKKMMRDFDEKHGIQHQASADKASQPRNHD